MSLSLAQHVSKVRTKTLKNLLNIALDISEAKVPIVKKSLDPGVDVKAGTSRGYNNHGSLERRNSGSSRSGDTSKLFAVEYRYSAGPK